jgi:S-formylglutathione hydrolase FrmB
MGGFGAISYAARRPDLFQAAASFSGPLDTRHPTTGPLSPGPYAEWVLSAFFEPLGYDGLALFGDPVRQSEIWAAHNPADLIGNLGAVTLFVSCGNGELGPHDPPGSPPEELLQQLEAALLLHNREFLARAERDGLDVTADLYGPGTHTAPYWARELERALPLLLDAIDA